MKITRASCIVTSLLPATTFVWFIRSVCVWCVCAVRGENSCELRTSTACRYTRNPGYFERTAPHGQCRVLSPSSNSMDWLMHFYCVLVYWRSAPEFVRVHICSWDFVNTRLNNSVCDRAYVARMFHVASHDTGIEIWICIWTFLFMIFIQFRIIHLCVCVVCTQFYFHFSDCLLPEIIAYLIMSNKSVAQNKYTFYLHSTSLSPSPSHPHSDTPCEWRAHGLYCTTCIRCHLIFSVDSVAVVVRAISCSLSIVCLPLLRICWTLSYCFDSFFFTVLAVGRWLRTRCVYCVCTRICVGRSCVHKYCDCVNALIYRAF